MSTTLNKKDGILPLVDYDWYAFCQSLYGGIEGEDWGEIDEAYKEMSRAVEKKKPQGSPERKRPLENEGSPCVKTISKEETRQDWHFGKSTSKIQLLRWTKALKCVEDQY